VTTNFVIIGGGPAGTAAASHGARLGAKVTLVEADIVGGTAHLRDCIPSKTMIATGGAMSFTRRIEGMGLAHQDASLDLEAQRRRVAEIEAHLNGQVTRLLQSQGVRIIAGIGRLKGRHEVVAETEHGIEEIDADAILVSTGSRPRIPDWASPDGDRILTTRSIWS
jgi:NAD(P)H dehydrogenase (quinone)